MKQAQLKLIETDNTWRLDTKTIKTGQKGLAKARAALTKTNQQITTAAA